MDDDLTNALRELELSHLIPSVRADREQLSSILHESFTEIGASGTLWTREAVLEHVSAEPEIQRTMDQFECTQLCEGVVLTTYRVTRTDQNGTQTQSRRSSIWQKVQDAWKLRFHQGTPL
jgi:ribonuclease HI